MLFLPENLIYSLNYWLVKWAFELQLSQELNTAVEWNIFQRIFPFFPSLPPWEGYSLLKLALAMKLALASGNWTELTGWLFLGAFRDITCFCLPLGSILLLPWEKHALRSQSQRAGLGPRGRHMEKTCTWPKGWSRAAAANLQTHGQEKNVYWCILVRCFLGYLLCIKSRLIQTPKEQNK